MKARKMRTPQEIRAEWRRVGMTQADWARQHGFHAVTVGQILNGKNRGSRGVGHRIAVLLGLKDGAIVEGDSTAWGGAERRSGCEQRSGQERRRGGDCGQCKAGEDGDERA